MYSRRLIFLFFFLFGLLGLTLPFGSLCFASEKTGVTEQDVKNFVYRLSFGEEGPVQLKNGSYIHPYPEYRRVWIDRFLIEDVDGDGLPDALVVLAQNGGGSGTFFELTALFSRNGTLSQTNSIFLGDRVKIDDIKVVEKENPAEGAFEPKKIILEMWTHKETDPSCCPSQKEVETFAFYKGQLVSYEDVPPIIVKKPAIYLYPQKPLTIDIRVSLDGEMTKSIPPYNQGWTVVATPQGKIDGKYDYLFYEAKLNVSPRLSCEGWVVSYKEIGDWFDQHLIELGLNAREASDFKAYWLHALEPSNYYAIRLIDREWIDKKLRLDISPKPQTLIRLMLYFQPIDQDFSLKVPKLQKIERKGFTVVEWGGILEGSNNDVVVSPAYSFLPSDIGLLALRAAEVKEHKISIKVNSGGCTDRDSVKLVLNKIGLMDNQVPIYEAVFFRQKPDFCKAFLPDGVTLTYDLEKDFGLKMPYMIHVKNPVVPIVKEEPYFSFQSMDASSDASSLKIPKGSDEETSLKSELIQATINAIKLEMERYATSSRADKKEKLALLEKDLEHFEKMNPKDYLLKNSQEQAGEESEFESFGKFGPLMPPLEREAVVVVNDKLDYGSILTVTGMTRSGPFYHISGIKKADLKCLSSGKHKVRLYLVYKREYFAGIQDYYVYVLLEQ